MEWILLAPQPALSRLITATRRQADFDADPQGVMDEVFRSVRPAWNAYPYLRWHVNRVAPGPSAAVTILIQSPQLYYGGLPAGTTRFMIEYLTYVTAGGSDMARGLIDSNGPRHKESGSFRYVFFQALIPPSGILKWGIENLAAAKWIRRPSVLGRSGFHGWINQIWRWA